MKLWQWGRSGSRIDVIGEIADEAGKLGIEICDVAGHVEEVAARVKRQAELCGDLRDTAAATASGNHGIAAAAREAREVSRRAGAEVAGSRETVEVSLQEIRGMVEAILVSAGFELTMVPDSHLCCGSAGTYSILEPELSQRLLKNKVAALESGNPSMVATANIGCLTHIQSGTAVTVKHWINILDERLS